jgi:hypothetical protein
VSGTFPLLLVVLEKFVDLSRWKLDELVRLLDDIVR